MGPQGDEFYPDVEVPHPQPRREEREFILPRPIGQNAAQEEARGKRPKVMKEQYDSKTSWLDYVAHFEICSGINGWSTLKMINLSKGCLKQQVSNLAN